jgi:anti-sigma regulatory factor (Ser/Thr protein kinase)
MNSERLLHLGFTRPDLPMVRVRLAATLQRAGLTEPALGTFVHAVLEIVTNAILHGGGQGNLMAVAVNGEVRCEVTDRGPGPAAVALRTGQEGRGLMLAEALAGRLEVRPGPGNRGTTVVLAALVR